MRWRTWLLILVAILVMGEVLKSPATAALIQRMAIYDSTFTTALNIGAGGVASVAITNGSVVSTDAATRSGANANVAEVNVNQFQWVGDNAGSGGHAIGWERARNCPNKAVINQATATRIITGESSRFIYICDANILVDAAQSIALVEGTGTPCTISAAAVLGGATANTTNGVPLAANSGWFYNYQGRLRTATAGNSLCLFQSGTAHIGGVLTYIME